MKKAKISNETETKRFLFISFLFSSFGSLFLAFAKKNLKIKYRKLIPFQKREREISYFFKLK